MIHIILVILKVLGIIIVSIIGLVLLIGLVCLFVPVLYRIKGYKHEQDMGASGRVAWLFITAAASITNEERQVKVKIKLFGISIEVFQKIGKVIKAPFKLRGKKEKPKEVKSAKSKPEIVAEQVKTKEVKTEEKPKIEQEKDAKEKAEDKDGPWNRLKQWLIKVWNFPKWLYARVRKICLTIKEFCGKINQWKQFLTGDTFKRALRFAMNRGNALRKHTLPRKIKGNVIYGFDDPAITGQTLAVASTIIPLYKGKFQIIPMFDKQILEGDIYMKGHVFGFTLARIAWSVYRNKDVKEVIHHFSQREA